MGVEIWNVWSPDSFTEILKEKARAAIIPFVLFCGL